MEEDRASAIAPEEDKELDQLLNEIIELFDESDKAIDETKHKTGRRSKESRGNAEEIIRNFLRLCKKECR